MGRYAFFNTEFEYKFRFGVQPSSDIRTFGGRYCFEFQTSGNKHQEWEERDLTIIYKELEYLVEYSNLKMPDFEKYDNSLHGTYELKSDLDINYEKLKSSDEEEDIVARFILGCLIYHQLLYTEKLFVSYEE